MTNSIRLVHEREITEKYNLKETFSHFDEIYDDRIKNYYVLFCEGDLQIEGSLNLDSNEATWGTQSSDWLSRTFGIQTGFEKQCGIAALVVMGNLTVNGNIVNGNDNAGAGVFVAKNLKTYNLTAGGAWMEINGDAEVEECTYAYYNDGLLSIGGMLRTTIFISEEHDSRIGAIEAIFSMPDAFDDMEEDENGNLLLPKGMRGLIRKEIKLWDVAATELRKGFCILANSKYEQEIRKKSEEWEALLKARMLNKIEERKVSVSTLPDPEIFIEINGIQFKAISLLQAHEIIGGLTYFDEHQIFDVWGDDQHFPYTDNAVFLLAGEDVQVSEFYIDNETVNTKEYCVLGFIFSKNLTAEKFIYVKPRIARHHPAMIVLGETKAKNIALAGSTLNYFNNGLTCDTIIGMECCNLYVKGLTKASLIYGDGEGMHFEEIETAKAIINRSKTAKYILTTITDEDGHTDEIHIPSTLTVYDIVHDENTVSYTPAIKDSFYENVFAPNLSLIDEEKEELYTYKKFKNRFLEFSAEFSALKVVKEEGSVGFYNEHDQLEYWFSVFEDDGHIFHELGLEIKDETGIRMFTRLDVNAGELSYFFQRIDEDGNIKYEWNYNDDETDIFASSVKQAMLQGYELLKADI